MQNVQLKIIQIGNSQGVILPKKFIQALNLTVGKTVKADVSVQGVLLKNPQSKQKSKSSITEEFLTVLKRVNKQYKIALQTLAEK